MPVKPSSTWLIDEVADFLASCPSRESILAFHPSVQAMARVHALLAKSKNGTLSTDEECELNQYEHLEILLQSIKARLRSHRAVSS